MIIRHSTTFLCVKDNHSLLIDVKDLNAGLYFIHFINKSGQRITKKWIKL
ncbi:MAG: T9SS type A sorting domain-containing protein [Saprospiraceae bacterium]|nr:T9SS type A sorting domain-containing protein [Saprospiraceae bacterium]